MLGGASVGCQDMYDQPRYKPLGASTFFADRRASRPVVPGTIARGRLAEDPVLATGKSGGADAVLFPFPITRAVLERGHERYDVFCSPCHDRAGTGRGMVVRRGFRQPPSFHQDRLRIAPPGHYFDAITNGFGSMYSYASRIPPRDRWAIAAYVRALQLSQNVRLQELAPEDQARVEGAK